MSKKKRKRSGTQAKIEGPLVTSFAVGDVPEGWTGFSLLGSDGFGISIPVPVELQTKRAVEVLSIVAELVCPTALHLFTHVNGCLGATTDEGVAELSEVISFYVERYASLTAAFGDRLKGIQDRYGIPFDQLKGGANYTGEPGPADAPSSG